MFFSSKKSILGIDIGTNGIKIAQVTTKENTHILDTYGLVNLPFTIDETREDVLQRTAEILRNLIDKAGVTTAKTVASLANSSVFTSIIEMPKLSEEELKQAVEFEAKKYVPLPMDQCTLSWTKLEALADGRSKVLITAVPNTMLRAYLKIFALAKLQPFALEIESLALIRSIVGDDRGNDLLIDIGAKATHLNITEKGNLVLTRSTPIGGETITKKIAESLNITDARAEQFKKDFGMNQSSVIPQTIRPILMAIKTEALQLQSIYNARNKQFDKIILVGGGANLPGLMEFFSDMGPKVIKGDALSRVTFNPELKPLLSQYATNLAVAIGLALREGA